MSGAQSKRRTAELLRRPPLSEWQVASLRRRAHEEALMHWQEVHGHARLPGRSAVIRKITDLIVEQNIRLLNGDPPSDEEAEDLGRRIRSLLEEARTESLA